MSDFILFMKFNKAFKVANLISSSLKLQLSIWNCECTAI